MNAAIIELRVWRCHIVCRDLRFYLWNKHLLPLLSTVIYDRLEMCKLVMLVMFLIHNFNQILTD